MCAGFRKGITYFYYYSINFNLISVLANDNQIEVTTYFMSEQKATNTLIKRAQTIRNQGTSTNKKLNELLKYQASSLKTQNGGSPLFACFSPKSKPSTFSKDWQRGYQTLSRVQKANLYLRTCSFISHANSKSQKSVTDDFQTLVLVKNSSLLGGWDQQQMQIQAKNKKILLKKSKRTIDLRQYLVRKSKQQIKSYLVLECTVKTQNSRQSIRISPLNPEEYEKIFTTVSQLCLEALKQQILQLNHNSEQLPLFTNKQSQKKTCFFQPVTNFSKIQQNCSQIQRKQSLKLQISRSQSIKQINNVDFRQIIEKLGQFKDFSQTQQNIFEQKSGNRVKKLNIFDSKDKYSVLKHLSNYCYFYRFKPNLSSVALKRKLGDDRVQIKEIYMHFQGEIIQCSYSRQKIETQDKVYFIDSLFRITQNQSQSLLDQSYLNNTKVQNSYTLTEVKNLQNGKIQVLSQGLIQFEFKLQSKQSFTKRFLGALSTIKIQSLNLSRQISTTTRNLNSTLNPTVKNISNDYIQSKFTVSGKIKDNIECRQKGIPNLIQWQKGVHFLWGKDWVVLDKGGLLFINQQKRKAQSNFAKTVIKNIGKQLLKGQSIFNITLPIQANGRNSVLQKVARCCAYAPILLQKATKKDQISRFNAVVCYALTITILGACEPEKPFNPILGETYQGFIDGCPIYSQQISHHPPITCLYLHGRGYNYSASIQPIIGLGLNSMTGTSGGKRIVTFNKSSKRKQQTINISFINFLIEGLVFGNRKFTLYNFYQVYDEDNRLFCRIYFGKNKKIGDSQINKYQDFLYGKLLKVTYGFDFETKKQINQQEVQQEIGLIQGRWTQSIKFNDQVILNLQQQIPFKIEECTNTLESHCNNRKDIQFRRIDKLEEGQNAKQELENLQRHDAKLRKQRKQTK